MYVRGVQQRRDEGVTVHGVCLAKKADMNDPRMTMRHFSHEFDFEHAGFGNPTADEHNCLAILLLLVSHGRSRLLLRESSIGQLSPQTKPLGLMKWWWSLPKHDEGTRVRSICPWRRCIHHTISSRFQCPFLYEFPHKYL